MKKVRLFAVAAALGMFAASVNAAGPVVSKDAYKATWGTMDEIVRAEIGGKVVLPTPSVSVTKQTRTTDPEKATSEGGLFGSTLTNKCYVGLTDTVGTDSNGDGIADWDMLFVKQALGHVYGTSTPSNWYYDDLKFFPSVKTSLYYIGMTGNGLGARFIAPNAAAEKGWIVSSTHTKYATEADVLTALETQGVVKAVKDSRGDIVKYVVGEKVYNDTNDKPIAKVWVEYAAGSGRYDLEELPEYVVSKFDGATLTPAVTSVTTSVKAVEYYISSNSTPVVYSATLPTGATGDGSTLSGKILVVEEDRYGELKVVDAVATAGTINAETGKVIVALKDGTNYSKYMTITPAVPTSGTKYSMSWDSVANSFAKKDTPVADLDALAVTLLGAGKNESDLKAAAEPVAIKTAKGLYKYNNPANTTDKIVINFDLGVYGWSLAVNGINTSKSTMTLVDAKGDELTTSAVKLGNKWYPTVNNVDELGTFVKRMAGLYTPEGEHDDATKEYKSIYDAMKDKKAYSTITWLDGTKNAEYIPLNAKAHYKATQCTYLTGETAVDAANVAITNNASEIDTNQYGVHTVTLTAKVGETTVGTKDVKVVIAPKYVREYKNGKVTSLKAYHLNGNLYSHTTFDYTAKKATAVFYAQDGVTAVETQSNDIK